MANKKMIDVYHRVTSLDEVLKTGGAWSSARFLLNGTPPEKIELHYGQRMERYKELTLKLASIYSEHFAKDPSYKHRKGSDEEHADRAITLGLARTQRRLADEYAELRVKYFVFGARTYEQTRGIRMGDLFVLKFGIPPEDIRNGIRDHGWLPVWGNLPLNNLKEVYASPEDADLAFCLLSTYRLDVPVKEAAKSSDLQPRGRWQSG